MSWTITDAHALEDAIFQLRLKTARKIKVRKGMTIVDLGSGQGGFTAAVAMLAGETGKVFAVDATREHIDEFTERIAQHNVKDRVTFIQADGTNLRGIIPDGTADMTVSFRLLEELKQPDHMPKIIGEMTRIVKKGGKVCLTELNTVPRNKAEEAYIRLHKESGDCFFSGEEIVEAMKANRLKEVSVEKVDTDIWFSPQLAKQDLSFAQVWFDPEVEKSLGSLIDSCGMKYPQLLIFSGQN